MVTYSVRVKITGMTCNHCVNTITKALQEFEGISSSTVEVSLENSEATFKFEEVDPNRTRAQLQHTLAEAIEDLGYDAGTPELISSDSPETALSLGTPNKDTALHATIPISGMTCSHCTNTVTKALQALPSIDPESIQVSLEDETAKMTFRNPIDDTITEEKLKEIIEDLGYDVGEINLVTQASNQQQVKAIDINNNSKLNSSDNVTTVVFSLSGMTCQHCVKSVSDTLRNLPGVLPSTVLVSLEKRQGCFSFEGSSVDAHKVKEVIEDLGYDLDGKPRFSIGARPNSLEFMPSFNSQTAISMDENSPLFPSSYQSAQGKRRKVVMRVLGMTCHSCVASVTDALTHEIPNVEPDSVHVNLQAEMAMFICTDPNIDLIYCVVGDRGFDIENVQIIHNLIPPSVVLASSNDDQGAVSQQQERKRQNSLVSSLGAVSIDSRQSVFVPHKVTFQISGMTCASCVRTIEKGLVNLPSVDPTSVQVNLLTQTGTLSVFRGDILDEQAIINAVKKMGYTASKVIFIASQQPPSTSQQQVGATFKAELIIPDMHCPKCVEKVHSALIKLLGIRSQSIQVDLDSCRARFEFTGEFITRQRIYQSIRDFGLSADSIKISKIHKEVDDTASLSPSIKSNNKDQFASTHLVVTGMTCASCVANIERTMMKQPGVVSCHVNLLAKSAVIEHDPSLVGARSLAQMIEQIGYKAELAQESGFTISEQRASMRESLDKELAVLRSRFLWSLLFAVPVVLIAMIFMMALPMSHPIRQFFMREIVHGLSISDLILFLLATPVQFWLGMPFYVKAYKSLVCSRTANMETLVAMGTTVAYVASVASVIATMARPMAGAMSMNYFETAVLLITFIHFGKWLEAMAKGKTAETITKLMDLQPEKATLVEISKNSRQSVDVSTSSSSSSSKTNVEENEDTLIEREIDSKDIQVGDILKINAGGRIPCDGKVWRGSSAADESMITGESVPVTKKKGDSVITATINLSAPIYIRAIRVGSDTTLSRIIQLVQDAQASPKAPIEQLADNISSVFVPVVILLALVTFIVWEVLSMKDLYPDDWVPMGENKTIFSLMLAVTVLVIACPCGLGLASPTAVMVGTGVAAKYGVLVKGGGYALEMANRITTVAFDKTGTLTMGKPIVTHSWIDLAAPATSTKEQDDVKTNSAQKRMAIWKILGRVSSASNHPLSKSIEKKARYIIQALAKNPKLSDSELILNSVEAEAVEGEYFDDLPVAQGTSAEDLFDGVTITNAQEVPGRGLLATITLTKEISDHLAGKLCHVRALNVFLGNQEWMDENHAVHQTSRQTKECHKLVTDWQNLGQSIVLVAASPVAGQNEEQDSAKDLHKDGCKNACACDVCNCASNSICCTASKTLKIAQLAIADIPRPEATALIAELRKREIEVWMITGDNERTGRVIGKQLGIPAEYVLAGVKPEQKSDKIRNLQRRGIRTTKEYHDGENKFWKRRKSNGDKFRDTAVVAMVGDGINDSPALAQADVGISVGSATDIAIEAASIVLIRNNLMDLLTMYNISRTVVRRIRFNFLWAFLYNAIAIPIAAGILYPATGQGLPPYIAGIAMVASSVSVVCSSLLLRLYKAPKIVEDSHRIKL